MNTEEKFTVPSTQFVENPDGYVLKASRSFMSKAKRSSSRRTAATRTRPGSAR